MLTKTKSMADFISSGLSKRAVNGLIRYFEESETDPNSITIEQWATETTMWKLLQTNHVGRKTLDEIKQRLCECL